MRNEEKKSVWQAAFGKSNRKTRAEWIQSEGTTLRRSSYKHSG